MPCCHVTEKGGFIQPGNLSCRCFLWNEMPECLGGCGEAGQGGGGTAG